MTLTLDSPVVGWLRETFSPDGKADVEHEARGSLGYGWIHYGLIRALRPDRVLAIGSRTGFIPSILALGCRDNARGTVDFVDAAYDRELDGKAAWDGVGKWRREAFGPLDPQVVLHVERSDEFFARQPVTPAWGYAHIDGGHDRETATHDVEQAMARMTPGGIVAVHDTHHPKLQVRKLVSGWRSRWALFEFPGPCGLVLMQAPC